jgi:SAM-dependent methyltransferase
MEEREIYSLAVGDRAATRLQLLDEVYGPGTRQLLTRAGLSEGMRVLDLGCGVGTVTCWMAQQVTPSGTALGLDVSTEQLGSARQLAQARGLENVTFREGSAYQTGLPRASFDLVYCRFLLMHLQRPLEALQEMRALLRPGGVLVCEEAVLDSSFCEPPSEAQARLHALALALGSQLGQDFRIARSLHRLVRDAGFSAPQLAYNQPVFTTGAAKRLEALSFVEVVPRLLATGLASAEEVDAVVAGLERDLADETVLYAMSRMTQLWARR